jgi:hypothetical protein
MPPPWPGWPMVFRRAPAPCPKYTAAAWQRSGYRGRRSRRTEEAQQDANPIWQSFEQLACSQQESVYREARRQRGPPHGTNLSSTLSPDYDYFSLISLLDASPSLETWRLEVRCYPSYISSKLIYVATNLGAFIDSISWFYIVLGS